MINNDSKKIRPLYYLLTIIFLLLVAFDYSHTLEFWKYDPRGFESLNVQDFIMTEYLKLKADSDFYFLLSLTIRALTLLWLWMLWISEVNYIKNKAEWDKKKGYYLLILCFGIIFFLLGYVPEKGHFLNYLLIPIGFIFSNIGINYLSKKKQDVTEDEDPLAHLPEPEESNDVLKVKTKNGELKIPLKELMLSLETKKGTLYLPYPNYGIVIVGAAGYGKSFFVLMPLHWSWLQKGFPAFIYDFKGNPPTLGWQAYQMYYHLSRRLKKKMPKFHIFNPSDPLRSVRVNPLDPRYITNKMESRNLAETFFKNLDKEAIQKSDFWNKNGMSVFDNAIYTLAKYKPEFSSLGHFVALLLRPADELCKVLMHINPMIKKDMLALISAYEKEAQSQLAGVEATVALPVSMMNIPELFYLTAESETSLDISDPDDPTIFVACSNPKLKKALQPVLGLISCVVKDNINQQNRLPCLFSADELKTQFILDLADLPAEARSNGVVTCVAFQTLKQLEEQYGKLLALQIWQNLTNQFILRIGDKEQAQLLQDTAGEYEKIKKGSSMSMNEGNITLSENVQKEKVMPISKIMQQPKGHAYGMIAGVDKPMFGCDIIPTPLEDLMGVKKSDFVDLPQYYTDDVTDQDLIKKMNDVWLNVHREVDEWVAETIYNNYPDKKSGSPFTISK